MNSSTSHNPSINWKNSRCPGCKEDLLPLQPKLLSCFHSICSRCIINSGNQTGGNCVVCIICKQESNLGNIIDNEFIKDIQGKDENDLSNITCTSCDDNTVATSFCPECGDYLCETCVMAHGRTKLTKHHKIKPKEEIPLNTSSSPRTCTEHEFEKLTWYCVDCSKVTCRDCQLNNHRNHEYISVDEISGNELGKIKKVMKELEASLPTLRIKKASIMKSVTASEKEEEEIKIAVKEQSQNVKKLVEEWETSLLSMLRSKVEPYIKSMTNSIMEIDNVITSILNANQFTENIVAQGNVIALLQSKSFIIKELEKLQDKGKLNPVFNTNSYQFFREKTNILANCIKKSAYIFEKGQNSDSSKFLIASVSAADEVNEDKLVQCRSCHNLTDFGPTCESCGMPIPHNLNPEKRLIAMDAVKNEDRSTEKSVNQESNENLSNLEDNKNMQLNQEANVSKKHSAGKKGVEQSENTEKTPAEKKSRVLLSRSRQKEKKTPSNSTADSDDNDSVSEKMELLISSSSEDETYVPKKQLKQRLKRSSSSDSRSLSTVKRSRGRPFKAGSSRTTPTSSRSSTRDSGTPSTSGSQPSPKLDLSTICELRQLLFKCRSIRIGSLKTIPRNPIDISVDGIDMVITNLKDGVSRGFHLLIPSKMIKEVSCHFGRSLPIMYVYTNSSFKDEIEKKFGEDIFDPDGDDESKKRIIILPDKFSDEDRLTIKNIFKDIGENQNKPGIFVELDVKAANAVLVMSTPSDQS